MIAIRSHGVEMVNYDDKRNFYRMMLNSEVSVTIIDDEANSTIVATCRDLSATGMAIEMASPLEINTCVRLSIDSSGQAIQPLDVTGRVVRVTEESFNNYLIGINIAEID